MGCSYLLTHVPYCSLFQKGWWTFVFVRDPNSQKESVRFPIWFAFCVCVCVCVFGCVKLGFVLEIFNLRTIQEVRLSLPLLKFLEGNWRTYLNGKTKTSPACSSNSIWGNVVLRVWIMPRTDGWHVECHSIAVRSVWKSPYPMDDPEREHSKQMATGASTSVPHSFANRTNALSLW